MTSIPLPQKRLIKHLVIILGIAIIVAFLLVSGMQVLHVFL